MMKSEGKKCIIQISQEQHENVKNVRKTLKVLQHSADKENLTGRKICDKDSKVTTDTEKQEVKRKKYHHRAVQTGESVITADDLTSDEPGLDYWKTLAEKRGEALNDSLQEVEKLKDDVETLQEENRICKEMLNESRHLVDVLQEMLGETDTSICTEIAEEATELDSEIPK